MTDLKTGGSFGAALREILADDTAFERHREANLRPETVKALADRIAESGVKYIYYMLPTLGSRTVAKVLSIGFVVRTCNQCSAGRS